MAENVNHPAHYQGRFECIDEMLALFGVEAVISFCRLNAYKYRFRAGMKGGAEDIQKAEWYVAKAAELQGLHITDMDAVVQQAMESMLCCDDCLYGDREPHEAPCSKCRNYSEYVRSE